VTAIQYFLAMDDDNIADLLIMRLIKQDKFNRYNNFRRRRFLFRLIIDSSIVIISQSLRSLEKTPMKTISLFAAILSFICVYSQEQSHLQGSTIEGHDNDILKISNAVQASALEVSVFPNPSEGNLTIEGKEGSIVTVYSTSGIYVGTWIIGAGGRVSLEDITTGSYICSVERDGSRCMKRFVVL
jgi:hypothetical protein